MRILLALLIMLPLAARAERLTVIELFTSQGCSSCPPADAVLAELARTDPGLLALGLHITYWDRLGWKDPYALQAATQRQREVSARLEMDHVYTPQMVVDGRLQAVGSDRAAVRRLIAKARAERPAPVALDLVADPAGLRIAAGAGAGSGTLIVVGFDPQHMTAVRSGENGGRTLTHTNVVRALAPAGAWSGQALALTVARPPGERTAVLLQADDGRILSAAVLAP